MPASPTSRMSSRAMRASSTFLQKRRLTLVSMVGTPEVPATVRSTVYRWADGSVDPKLSRFEAVMSAIEARLAIEEDKLRGALVGAAA